VPAALTLRPVCLSVSLSLLMGLISPSLRDTCSVAPYDRSLMPGTLPGEGADHPSVTDTSVIIALIPPLAVSANKSPGCFTVLPSTEHFETNVSFGGSEPLALDWECSGMWPSSEMSCIT
jgi:hypothetical protein